ncbi:hypothetical protein VTI74DRAFT_8358 [Chaetomium olivicolor]
MESAPTSPSPTAVLDGDSLAQLNTAEAKTLLDTIDSLRELHVGDIVNLPQIIVVGDQSSGKSSVLEAISGVRFPVDGDLCTRFATELILRRAPQTTVNPFRRSTFDKEALPDIIKEAKERMGIREGSSRKFAKEILRVEIAGPDVYPLTLVDLPGISRSATADQDLEGKEIVDHLIASYMEQPKSIVLAVVAANNQLSTQDVLQRARTHDPKRVRTIGVITKPDLTSPGSANERKYLDLVKGRESMHRLSLGWYVLRNRSEAERSSETDARNAVEERFFRSGAWSSVSPANRGIESLRKRLSKVLLNHIKRSLPDIIRDIESNLRTRQEELDRLGKSRSTPEELRFYLSSISARFKTLAEDAVGGRYANEFFGGIEQQETKLRAKLRNMNRAFCYIMVNRGALCKIDWDSDSSNSGSGEEVEEQLPEYLRPLIEEYGIPIPETKSESKFRADHEESALSNQGMEFPGEVNGNLARQLFKEQSTPWENIAWRHLQQVLKTSQEFVERAFYHIIGVDTSTLRAILNDRVDPFFEEKQDTLREKLKELLHPYSSACGLPLEDEYRKSMHGSTLHHLGRRIAERLEESHPGLFKSNVGNRLERWQIQQAVSSLNDAETDVFGLAKAIKMMAAFYDISLRIFINNVINLAVERCLVSQLSEIFALEHVESMTVEQLQDMASESEEVRTQRLALQDEIKILKEGLRKCQKHKLRDLPETSTYSPHRSLGLGSELTSSADRDTNSITFTHSSGKYWVVVGEEQESGASSLAKAKAPSFAKLCFSRAEYFCASSGSKSSTPCTGLVQS